MDAICSKDVNVRHPVGRCPFVSDPCTENVPNPAVEKTGRIKHDRKPDPKLDPDYGKPYRHNRARARLMLGELLHKGGYEGMAQVVSVVEKLIDRDPLKVEQALADVIEEHDE
jgi:hypothetical protein